MRMAVRHTQLVKRATALTPPSTYVFTLWLSAFCMHPMAWLAADVSPRLARTSCTASSAKRSRRLRSTRAAAPGLIAHAEVTTTELK